MKKSLILLAALAGALSAQALDVNTLKANENGKFWSGRAAEGYGISIGTEPKVLYNTLKVSSADGALVIDTREFFKRPDARKIVTRFYIKNNIAALKGKETSAKVQIQAEEGSGAVNLYLEGNRGAEKKHYYTAQQFAVSDRSEIVHTKQLPEDVNGIAIRLDLNKPAVYRIFNAAISANQK